MNIETVMENGEYKAIKVYLSDVDGYEVFFSEQECIEVLEDLISAVNHVYDRRYHLTNEN